MEYNKKIIVDIVVTTLYIMVVTTKEDFMESKELNISFYKAGSGISARVNLPKKWIVDMGLSPENKNVEVIYDEETKTISIKKK